MWAADRVLPLAAVGNSSSGEAVVDPFTEKSYCPNQFQLGQILQAARMSDRVSILLELQGLQSELSHLQERLIVLIGRLEESEFEVVPSAADPVDSGYGPSSGASQGPLAGSQPAPSSRSAPELVEGERRAIAAETGQFFLRCIRGQPRGVSGQGRIKLQKRVYVVVRTFAGIVHRSPVLVFRNFADTKALVADQSTGEFGDSVFAGFASQWEAKVAVREAGYTWPN